MTRDPLTKWIVNEPWNREGRKEPAPQAFL